MEPDANEELVLAEQVANGDERALQTFYDRYADLLFAFIFQRLNGARPEAEEVWQDTLLAAVRSLQSFRGESRLFSWLCGIARNKIADHLRRQNRVMHKIVLLPPDDPLTLMDCGPLPDEILCQRATCLRVVETLGALPAEYRLALTARYAEGKSVPEIAQLLDKSYKATESILSRAREAFRTALSSQTELEL